MATHGGARRNSPVREMDRKRGGGRGRRITAPKREGERLAEISNGLVQLHSQFYGKGPTAAKTFRMHDTIVCVLREGFTTVERTLIDDGKPEAVYSIRRTFQKAMESRFRDVVERATGKTVVAYMSQIHVDPDVAVELFLLEPGEKVIGEHEIAGEAALREPPAV